MNCVGTSVGAGPNAGDNGGDGTPHVSAASQAEVDGGTVNNKYVSPLTLENWDHGIVGGGGSGTQTVTSNGIIIEYSGDAPSAAVAGNTITLTVPSGAKIYRVANDLGSSITATDGKVILIHNSGRIPASAVLYNDNGYRESGPNWDYRNAADNGVDVERVNITGASQDQVVDFVVNW